MEIEYYNEYESTNNSLQIEPPGINTNRYVCDECGQSYKYYSGLYSHKRTHDPNYVKKYSCSSCEYSHDNIYHLYSHINTHNNAHNNDHNSANSQTATIITNERKLNRQPNKCIKTYKEEEKIFKCPICDKKYNYRQSYQVHMKTHDKTRELKFQCIECDFKCDHKGQFNRHINSHL